MDEKKRPTFVTFFPQCEDIHITKDVGMIPYVLHRDYFYDSTIISYENDTYAKLISETPGLKINFLKRYQHFGFDTILQALRMEVTRGAILDSFIYFLKNGRKIDILQVYHFSNESLIVASIFRILNKKAKIYLKLDMSPDVVERYNKSKKYSGIKIKFFIFFLKSIHFDIISVETKTVKNFLETDHPLFRHFRKNIHYIPSGIDRNDEGIDLKDIFDKKESVILHVGRLSFDKGTDIAMNTFIGVSPQFPGWRMVLIGNMENSFEIFFSQMIERYPLEAEKIERTGFIQSSQELQSWYRKGKILLTPSLSESFGMVTIEAGVNGCVVLGSDIVSFKEITNNGLFGYLCPVNDLDCFKQTLKATLAHEKAIEDRARLFRNYVLTHYNWSEICGRLHNIFSTG